MAFVWDSHNPHLDADADLLISTSPWSEVHGRVQVVKRHIDPKTGRPAPETAINSFRSLQRLQELSLGSMIVGGPRPLELQPELGIVVMEYVPGPTLATVFRKAPIRQACGAAEKAGRWLAELQQIGGQVRGHVEVARILDHLREISTPTWFGRNVAEMLTRTAAAIARDTVPFVAIYGDFKPANLILGQDRLVGIDPGLSHLGPIAHDAAHFLNHVALIWPDWRTPLPLGRNRKLRAAFLDGYHQHAGVSLAGAHLTWLRLANAARIAAKLPAWTGPVQQKISRWQIANLVQKLRNQLNHELALMNIDNRTKQSKPQAAYP